MPRYDDDSYIELIVLHQIENLMGLAGLYVEVEFRVFFHESLVERGEEKHIQAVHAADGNRMTVLFLQ